MYKYVLNIYLYTSVLCTMAAVLLDDQTYCSLRYRRLCQGKGPHVACQFPQPGPAASCQNYSQIQFTRELQNFITQDINRRRQRIASGYERVRGGALLPKPQVMMLVSWDRELAYLAQRLADQCQFVHDNCRATVRYPYAGQSVGEVRLRRSNEAYNVQRAVRRVLDTWWGERRRVRPSQLTTPFKLSAKGLVWGHFSQLAVWTLRAVGCGAVTHGGDIPRLLLVCDFSHTNMLGQITIKPGPIAPCPVNSERRLRTAYPLLCAPIKRKVIEDNEGDKDFQEDLNYDEDAEELATVGDEALQETYTSKVKYDNSEVKSTKRRSFERTRDRVLDHQVTLKKYPQRMPIFGEQGYYRDTKDEEADDRILDKQTSLRPRWRHRRVRPNRPGANALFRKRPYIPPRPLSMVSLNLDKEDLEQLFRDTGFNVNWRQKIH